MLGAAERQFRWTAATTLTEFADYRKWNMELSSSKKYFLFVLPVLLTASTALVFSGAAQWLGNDKGYLLGFCFYWIWCLSVPFICWGKRGFRWIFTENAPFFRKTNWLLISLLSLTVAGAVWMYFIPALPTISLWVVVFAPVTIINGTCEEILWRGVYVKAFGKQVVWSCLYPAAGFALSHLASELVFPAEGGIFPFVMSTFFLGLVYGWVAYKTQTAKWTAITHSLIGLLAFGEPISTSIARLIFP